MSQQLAPERLESFVKRGQPLAPFTTWGVGGTTEMLIAPPGREDLISAARWLYGTHRDFYLLGGGSNVWFPDEPTKTPVLYTGRVAGMDVGHDGDEVFVTCASGTALGRVLARSMDEGWSGLEFAAGIPGTVGGAVAGNAGTRIGSIASAVARVRTIEQDGTLKDWRADELTWSYRESSLSCAPRVILDVTLALRRTSENAVRERVRAVLAMRHRQPTGVKTAGCVFRNPPGDSAGRLIDRAGCKGMTAGGARVSPVHANFIENLGAAAANDILQLARLCRKRVREASGVSLRYEVKFFGVPDDAAEA